MRLVRLKSCLRSAPAWTAVGLLQHAQKSVSAWSAAAEAHGSLIQSWVAGSTVVVDGRYPDPDVVDRRHGYQFFYHCHRHGSSEHGHLHLFFHATASGRRRYLRRGKAWRRTAPTHLLAIGLDSRGLPISLFTVNRWVTDGFWFDAAATLEMLRRCRLDVAGRYAQSGAWLVGFVGMYLPLVSHLLDQRDSVMRRASAGRGLSAALGDRRIDLISSAAIDWIRDVEDLEPAAEGKHRYPRRSERMAPPN